jgi:hypothetical protein
MTRGTWQTTDDSGGAAAAIGAGVIVGILAYGALKSAARTAGELLVIVPVAAGGLVLGAVLALLAVRARGRRRAAPPAPVQLWHANPQAIPPQPRREIAAPQVVVNIDAGLLAGLMAAQQQPAPVIVQAEHGELPR